MLSSDFVKLESQNSQLNSALEQRLSELAQVQAEKHQINLKLIEKDGEIERLSTEASELHKSKRQLIELVERKDLEISEKNSTNKGYLDKIVNLTDNAALREARLNEIETELARSHASCTCLSQMSCQIGISGVDEKFYWTTNEERRFLELAILEVRQGNLISSTFGRITWLRIERQMNVEFGKIYIVDRMMAKF